jgi:hypothetical protein
VSFPQITTNSVTLNAMIDAAIKTDWPTSSAFTPANVLMVLVQDIANMAMYI